MMQHAVEGPFKLHYWTEGDSYFLTKYDRLLGSYGYINSKQDARQLRDKMNKDWAFREYTSKHFPTVKNNRPELLLDEVS